MTQELKNRAVLGAIVGSRAVGLALEGSDDRDEMWVCLPKREEILGFATDEWTIVKRDRAEGERSQPGDTDRVYHSMKKWVRLVMKGNPTVLMPVFVKDEELLKISEFGKMLRSLGSYAICKQFYYPYNGYMISQWERLKGERGQMRVNRPELVEKYGYDTKYAYHVIRLGLEGIELLSIGTIEIPYQGFTKTMLMSVREGKYSFEQFGELYQWVKNELDKAYEKSELKERADEKVIEATVMKINECVVNGKEGCNGGKV